ncbi:MAG: membrane protein insertase YidC [Chitinophagales bacterium]|nr:membrane protein insertase YidC [Chitinophagales bacterium]
MDKNTITGFILLALMTVGYVFYTNNEQAKLEKQKAVVETISKSVEKDTLSQSVSIDTAALVIPIVKNLGGFTSFSQGNAKEIKIETEKAIYSFNSKGGTLNSITLKSFKTHDHQPLVLFDSNDNHLDLSFLNKEKIKIHTSELYFETSAVDTKIEGNDSIQIDFILNLDGNSQYKHSYVIHANSYLLDFNISSKNGSQFMAPSNNLFQVNWKQELPSLEQSIKEERMYSNLYYRTVEHQVDELSSSKNDDKILENGIQWVSFKQKFFNNTLISSSTPFEKGARVRVNINDKSTDIVKGAEADLKLPIAQSGDINYALQWYLGPNKYSDLRSLKIGLDEIIPLGWAIFGWVNKFLIIPVFNILGKFISNYGVIIFILTVLLKLVLAPLNRKQLISTTKMQILKPEIDELKKKYPNDKQMVGAKQMELFRNAGVNPMGGCLPMLLQMPILFAMYRFFPNSIELRQAPFLWATDLSHYDSIYTLPFTIPIYGNHVSLFTLLMAITSVAYTKIMMSQQSMSVGGNDDMMAMQMKMMQYLTPFMFLFMFNSFSAALSYYYFLFNFLSIVQTYVLKKFFINEDSLRAEIEFNKKQPKKKSAWQSRMEDMMEQQKAIQEKKKK